MTATKQKPTRATQASVLDYLAQNPVLADAMRSIGMAPNTVFVWAKLSRDGDERFKLAWPDPNGAEIWFHDGIVLARQMQCANFEATLRRDVTNGTPRTLRTPAGDVVYEMDHRLIAEWEGDADAARRLGGMVDPFFLHDQHGARVPVIVYDMAPAALRQHAARSLLAGYNPSNISDVNAKHSGAVLITKATGGAPAPYARVKMAPEVSPLKADLLQRLADLRERGPNKQTRPTPPVGGRDPADDPRENGANDGDPPPRRRLVS